MVYGPPARPVSDPRVFGEPSPQVMVTLKLFAALLPASGSTNVPTVPLNDWPSVAVKVTDVPTRSDGAASTRVACRPASTAIATSGAVPPTTTRRTRRRQLTCECDAMPGFLLEL